MAGGAGVVAMCSRAGGLSELSGSGLVMSEHLDRIRRTAGIVGAAPDHSVGVSSPAGGGATGVALGALVDSARAPRSDMSDLRVVAFGALPVALAAVFGYRLASGWLDGESWLERTGRSIVGFAGAVSLGPWVAGVAVVALLVLAVVTSGFSSGTTVEVVASVVSLAVVGLTALPLVLVMLLAIVIAILYIVLGMLLVAAVLALLFGASS